MSKSSDQKKENYQASEQNETIENIKFEKLFNQYFKPLCFFCHYKFGFDNDDAKDVVHSAFMRLFESQISFISESSAKAYLYKITAGIAIDLIRRKSVSQKYFYRQHLPSIDSTSNNNLDQFEFKQLQADLDRALDELPSQMRLVFELSRNESLKYSEIAQELGISKKTVETQMSRALARLRQKLASYL